MMWVSVSMKVPYKTAQRVAKLAVENDLSKANMYLKLIEEALLVRDEPVEVSRISPIGERHDTGVPILVHNTARKIL